MKRIKVNRKHADTERRILIGMVTNTEFLRDIQCIYKREYLTNEYSIQIARWCVEYFEEFKNAPGVHIQDIFNDAVQNNEITDDARIKSIQRFLSRLSKEFKRSDKFNAKFMLKKAKVYFNTRAMENITEQAEDLKSKGKEEQAAELVDSFRKIEIPTDNVTDLKNVKELLNVFTQDDSKPLFKLSGGLGLMMNDEFKRQCFIGILGPEKIGKTWFLLHLALQSIKYRCNTVFIQAGDMSEDQQKKRIAISLTKKAGSLRYAGKHLVPILDCEKNQTKKCKLRHRAKNETGIFRTWEEYKNRVDIFGNRKQFPDFFEENEDHIPCKACKLDRRYRKHFKGTVWYKEKEIEMIKKKHIIKAHKKFVRRMGGDRFRLATYSNSTLTTDMIYAKLDQFRENEDFITDVVIVDYPDIMAEEKPGMDFRHSENLRWKKLRALSQDYNCLVIAVTQADAKSYDQKSLKRSNFSEDKRKYGHVTSFYTLNQTAKEKAAGIMRVGCLMARDNEQIIDECTILQHLSTGQAIIASYI